MLKEPTGLKQITTIKMVDGKLQSFPGPYFLKQLSDFYPRPADSISHSVGLSVSLSTFFTNLKSALWGWEKVIGGGASR